jgi:hypothetical protein
MSDSKGLFHKKSLGKQKDNCYQLIGKLEKTRKESICPVNLGLPGATLSYV